MILYLLDGIGIIAEERRAGNRVLLPNDNISDWLVCWRVQKPLEKLASPHGRLFYPFCVRTSFFGILCSKLVVAEIMIPRSSLKASNKTGIEPEGSIP